MRIFAGITDLEAHLASHIGYSDWLTITQDQIDAFADATGDHQWIHTDVEKAASGPFGKTIAHGYLTLSLISQFAWQIFTIEGVSVYVNYGANKVRFPTPVLVGSRIRCGAELVSLASADRGYLLTTRYTIEIEGTDKPACVVESLAFLVP